MGQELEELSQTWTRQLKALQAFPFALDIQLLTTCLQLAWCSRAGYLPSSYCPALLSCQTAASAATFSSLSAASLSHPGAGSSLSSDVRVSAPACHAGAHTQTPMCDVLLHCQFHRSMYSHLKLVCLFVHLFVTRLFSLDSEPFEGGAV